MRRSREDDDDVQNEQHQIETIQHPSKFFVPYTGRYYIHFIAKNLKNAKGHNMRLLLHSNGLCVLCLDPSHLLVVSYFTLLKSITTTAPSSLNNSGDNNNDKKRMIERLDFCESFPVSGDVVSASSASSPPPCPGAKSESERLVCNNLDDLYGLIMQQKVALCATSISHQVNGTRGQRDRLSATISLRGKGKRNAVYAQDEMTICSFPCEVLAKCPSCGKWQVIRQALQHHAPVAGASATEDWKEKPQKLNLPDYCVLNLPYIPPRENNNNDNDNKNTNTTKESEKGTGDNINNKDNTDPVADAQPTKKLQKPFFLPKSIKIPITLNSILVEVNSAISDAEVPVKETSNNNNKNDRNNNNNKNKNDKSKWKGNRNKNTTTDAAEQTTTKPTTDATTAATSSNTAPPPSNAFEKAFFDPMGSGFLGVVQPRADVSFSGKFDRAPLESPMVSPDIKVRVFVADSFTGTTEAQE